MEWINVLEVPLDLDMHQLNLTLKRDGVAHCITEQGGKQVLFLMHPQDKVLAEQRIAQWRAGLLPLLVERKTPPRYVWHALFAAPITLITALLGVLGSAIVWFDMPYLLGLLIFQSVELVDGNIYPQAIPGALADGRLWKLWSPMFLHFGIFHLLFNLLWLLEFGVRIERCQSGVRLLFIILLCGLVSNICQFFAEPAVVFGGLSGVVYGLFAYCALHSYVYGCSPLAPRPGVTVFLFAWLLIGISGIVSMLGIANIANAAHVGGLVTGLLLALYPGTKEEGGKAGN